jgi:hypothetical protein
MAKNNTEEHSFYCCKCGRRGMPIQRKIGSQRESLHKKNLYCIYCKGVVNHVECKTAEEVEEFNIRFNNGEYQEEAIVENSIFNVWDTRIR